jgi:hypothetical protein
MAEAPRAIISYSWSSPKHELWVIDLAERLVQEGVDIVLDRWDLREGQDKYKFMERMVADATIKKVIVVSDRIYSEKADQRLGGVGTESQIISPEVYARANQQKFVPVVTEMNSDGEPYLPTYLKGRIYIDMSDPASRYRNWEQLVRWLFDRPLHQRPPPGKPPSYVGESGGLQLGTASRARAATAAIVEDRTRAIPVLRDYFETFAENLESLRLQSSANPFDESVYSSIESFRPYRDEFVDVVAITARSRTDIDAYEAIHDFFERSVRYLYPPEGATSWRDDQIDNFRFIVQELFIYINAIFLRNMRLAETRLLLEQPYFVSERSGRESRLESFTHIRRYIRSLDEVRNKRLELNRLSLTSDMLKQRATRTDVRLEELMQADFVLHLYSVLHYPTEHAWFPNTLLYAGYGRGPFELFVRAESVRFFDRLKVLLNVQGKDQLLETFNKNSAEIPYGRLWQANGFDPLALMNTKGLASRA